jgi:hypothetical protein
MNSLIAQCINKSVQYLFSNNNIYKNGFDHAFINFSHNENEINLIEIRNELIKIIPTSTIHPRYLDNILIDKYNGKQYIYWIYKNNIFKLCYNKKQFDYPAYILIDCVH